MPTSNAYGHCAACMRSSRVWKDDIVHVILFYVRFDKLLTKLTKVTRNVRILYCNARK